MQRQSLGSPGRGGLVAKDDAVSKSEDQKRRESSQSSFSGDDEIKPEKPLRCHSQPEKFIHLIPILILLCFFILYLSSHDPSPSDLAQFNGFNHPDKLIDSTDIDDIGRVDNKLKRSNAFAIRSLRNLQEEIQEENTHKSRSHRKLGDF
ncbi:uncharacterized protein LOC104893019 [Beta vulgaris subsp. vulgaris]|uniref:uncharacterized protein LOC104893019 n=1 Tax=Beta vulgaris subsp. vulgaris TaxID=3555 RepID=UPI0020373528|nr:uncharacterized protein LOC104893019 [Beta vulgaris subsp. vulgaris]